MPLNLIIKTRIPPVTWKKFCKTTPPFSIALDGYVNAGPCYDLKGQHINFNHHENVDRLATRSTCAQAMIAIRQGLFDIFKDDDGPQANVYINDCDEDICLSWYLIKNFQTIKDDCPAGITRLVTMEDLMDATAGAYPMPIETAALKELAWIFKPYRQFRVNGGLDRREKKEFLQIINAVEERIEKVVHGQGEHAPLDTRYTKCGGGKNWSMFEELGMHAHTGAYLDGIRAFVSVRKVSETHWKYTVGKMSPFISFDMDKIIKALNKAEGNKRDKWGGANTIGGSPRVSGSKLTPAQVEEIINKTLEANQ